MRNMIPIDCRTEAPPLACSVQSPTSLAEESAALLEFSRSRITLAVPIDAAGGWAELPKPVRVEIALVATRSFPQRHVRVDGSAVRLSPLEDGRLAIDIEVRKIRIAGAAMQRKGTVAEGLD
jgi:hypothetical protein